MNKFYILPKKNIFRFISKYFIAILLLVSITKTQTFGQVTQVYNVPASGLVNMPNNCGTAGPYSVCSAGQSIGFNWTDILPAAANIISVNIQFRVGVECSAGAKNWSLNGANQGTHTTVSNGCSCSLGATPVSSLNAAATNYNPGGLNQFRINNGTSCLGMYPNWSSGTIYAIVTVTYG